LWLRLDDRKVGTKRKRPTEWIALAGGKA